MLLKGHLSSLGAWQAGVLTLASWASVAVHVRHLAKVWVSVCWNLSFVDQALNADMMSLILDLPSPVRRVCVCVCGTAEACNAVSAHWLDRSASNSVQVCTQPWDWDGKHTHTQTLLYCNSLKRMWQGCNIFPSVNLLTEPHHWQRGVLVCAAWHNMRQDGRHNPAAGLRMEGVKLSVEVDGRAVWLYRDEINTAERWANCCWWMWAENYYRYLTCWGWLWLSRVKKKKKFKKGHCCWCMMNNVEVKGRSRAWRMNMGVEWHHSAARRPHPSHLLCLGEGWWLSCQPWPFAIRP